jgi:hypothetical protein
MADVDKVRKGLEQCLLGEGCRNCGKCPYLAEECVASLLQDSLELLKEQQEKIDNLIERTDYDDGFYEGYKQAIKEQNAKIDLI